MAKNKVNFIPAKRSGLGFSADPIGLNNKLARHDPNLSAALLNSLGVLTPDQQRQEILANEKANPVSQYRTYYYSGGQAQIYMKDILLDEVFNLQFSTVTNKSPIYGYASERFDTVAKGNMIVQGSFIINFVHANYLQILAEALQQDEVQRKKLDGVAFFKDFANSKNISQFELQQALNQIRGLGNREFRAYARELQRETREDPLPKFYEIPPFDIFAVFGEATQAGSAGNSTVRTIREVYLTGQAQALYSNGEPVQEQYSFIARDIE